MILYVLIIKIIILTLFSKHLIIIIYYYNVYFFQEMNPFSGFIFSSFWYQDCWHFTLMPPKILPKVIIFLNKLIDLNKQMSILSLILFPTGFLNMMEVLDRSNKHTLWPQVLHLHKISLVSHRSGIGRMYFNIKNITHFSFNVECFEMKYLPILSLHSIHLQVTLIHSVCLLQIRVIDRVQQLYNKVTREELRDKSMLKRQRSKNMSFQ